MQSEINVDAVKILAELSQILVLFLGIDLNNFGANRINFIHTYLGIVNLFLRKLCEQ